MIDPAAIDENVIEHIAARVADALRDELADIAARTMRPDPEQALTVDDVAKQLGVARSTVYTHWREWGGYKLGPGDKASIRFRPSDVPHQASRSSKAAQRGRPEPTRPTRSSRRRTLVSGQARLPVDLTSSLHGATLEAQAHVLDNAATA